MENKQILSGMRPDELLEVVNTLGLPRFTAKQIATWLYQKRVLSFEEMTNLSKDARTLLAQHFDIGRSRPIKEVVSRDGTVKFLFRTIAGHYIETVYIPDRERATLCVSSQVGCRMGCRFCMTGRQGFQANLTVADILNQVYSVPNSEKLTNLVVMGQGEPFCNTDAILKAIEILTAPYGLGWSPKRITVSTVGIIPGMERFLRESKANLAVSLHFAHHEDRLNNMPAERSYPIQDVVNTLASYDFCRRHNDNDIVGAHASVRPNGNVGAGFAGPSKISDFGGVFNARPSHQRRLSFEYIVFEGLNDRPEHLDKLVRLLRPLDCRVNLIPFNSVPDVGADQVRSTVLSALSPNGRKWKNNENVGAHASVRPQNGGNVLLAPNGTPYRGASPEKMKRIRNYLTSKGLFSTLRASRGADIEAACGLLSTRQQEMERNNM